MEINKKWKQAEAEKKFEADNLFIKADLKMKVLNKPSTTSIWFIQVPWT